MFCRDCHYPLNGLKNHQCPECGRSFNPQDNTTYHAKIPRWWDASYRLPWRSLLAFCIIILLFLHERNLPRRAGGYHPPEWLNYVVLYACSLPLVISAIRRGNQADRRLGIAVAVVLIILFAWLSHVMWMPEYWYVFQRTWLNWW